jgi:hypothetical protein
LETSDKITQLENEIKVLKNEVQAVLLDIRENVLNAENPFSAQRPTITSQVVIDHQIQNSTPPPANEPKIAAAPAPAPVSAVPPAQPEKPAEAEQTREIHARETWEPEHNHNGHNGHTGGKASEIFEMEDNHNHNHNHNHNGRKPYENDDDDSRDTEQYENEPPRFEISEGRTDKRQPDLVAYAGLACWVEDSTRRLGKERTQAMLEMSQVAGVLPADVKDVLTKLTCIKSTEHSYKPTARDYFDSLVKLAAVFGNKSDYNAALLLVLAQGDVHG